MNIDACYELGYIVRTHGTKGQVIAFFDVDFPEDYEEMESVFLRIGGKLIPFFIDRIEAQAKGKFIIKFEDIDSLPDAEKLKGTTLFMPLDTLPELEDDQFYFHEIVGYTIVDENLGELGTVKEIYDMPHQDLISMDHQGHEVLIPIQDEVVLKADKENKKLFVNLPDGLLEVYTTPSSPEEEAEARETDEEDTDDDAV